MTNDHIIYPIQQKDLCDYDPECIISNGLIFDDIIMGIIRKHEFLHPTTETDCIFTQIDNTIIYMYRGSLQDFYWRKGTYECLEMPCVHLRLKKNEMKDYLTHVLKNDTSSGDMDEKLDHWFDSFEKFHNKYIIMLSISLNYLFLGVSLFVTVQSTPGFINRENETRYYLNATLQLLYFNVLFRKLVLNIDCYTMLNGLREKSQHFVHDYQKIMIMRGQQKIVGEIYLGGGGEFY